MISKEIIAQLKESKNLLAFSAGVDSSALFFLLIEHNIAFDIAIVNYGIREQAKEELNYAKELATKYSKELFSTDAPSFNSNFEANARTFRYTFFRKIMRKYEYTTLLTAHQLNDNLEWLLMRLSQGSGVEGLSGMQLIEPKEEYRVVRPLLQHTKEELLTYLEKKSIQYYIDETNFDKHHLRNQFRPIVEQLLEKPKSGYLKTLSLLQSEKKLIHSNFKLLLQEQELSIMWLRDKRYLPYALSQRLKELGYLLSGKERLNIKNSMVVGRKWAVEYQAPYLYIAPYMQTPVSKAKKEEYRKARIPAKIRGYLYSTKISLDEGLALKAEDLQ